MVVSNERGWTMRAAVKVAVALLVLIVLVPSCVPPPAPEGGATLPGVCCREVGGIELDFEALPFAPGSSLPPMFQFEGVEFVEVWEDIQFDGGSLWCYGSEESPPGSDTWHSAAVRLDFSRLPCVVCGILAEVHSGTAETGLEGRQMGGAIQTTVCSDTCGLTLTASVEEPFISALLSGAEAQWFSMRLE